MNPSDLMALLTPQIKELAASEAARATQAAMKKAHVEMLIGFALAALAGGLLGAKVFR